MNSCDQEILKLEGKYLHVRFKIRVEKNTHLKSDCIFFSQKLSIGSSGITLPLA